VLSAARRGSCGVIGQPAVVDRLAAAALRGPEPLANALGALDERLDLRQAPVGQLAQATRHRAVAVLEELADLAQREPGALRDGDHGEAPEDALVVAALAGATLGLGQQTDRFVVADQRDADPRPSGHLADAHRGFLPPRLDFEPA